MIELATLLLAAAALAMAFAAYRRSAADGSKDAAGARDAALRQELSELRGALDSMPGRIADEIAASPLREALEGVRESITRTNEVFDEHVVRVGQGIESSVMALQTCIDRGFHGVGGSIEAVRNEAGAGFKALGAGLESSRSSTESVVRALQASDPSRVLASLEAVMVRQADAASAAAAAERAGALHAALDKIEGAVAPLAGSVDRISLRVDALPQGLEPQFARVAAAVSGLSAGLTEIVESGRENARVFSGAVSSDKVVGAVEAQAASFDRVVDAIQAQSLAADRIVAALGQGGDSGEVVAAVRELGQEVSKSAKIAEEASLPVLEGLESLSRELGEAISALPLKIAEASANHARPMPELEELAIAVRESGHMRGDAARSVADAVSRVGQELSESADAASSARSESAQSLQVALERLEAFSAQIESRLAPLADALKGHGDAVGPIANGLSLAQDRLEEAAASLRANQVEFAASVGLFTQAAQELSGGLSLFAREGDRQGAEDPRAAQKALLESLDKLMGGFAESLKALLTESDLRTREVLTEIAARLPAGEGA